MRIRRLAFLFVCASAIIFLIALRNRSGASTLEVPGASNPLTAAIPGDLDGIRLGLPVFLQKTSSEAEKFRLRSQVDYVAWSDAKIDKPVSNIYIPFDRFKVNTATALSQHPDWIVYQCDRTTPAYLFGNTEYPPLDISNPEVREFQRETYIYPYLEQGYTGVFIDNIALVDLFGRCGTKRNDGTWKQLYDGQQVDAAYQADVLAWAKETYTEVKKRYPNVPISMNLSYDARNPTIQEQFSDYYDGIFDERGFTNYGKASNPYVADTEWKGEFDSLRKVLAKGKLVLLNAELPAANPGLGHTIADYKADVPKGRILPELDATIDPEKVTWALANYLLVRNENAYAAINPYYSELATTAGVSQQLGVQGYGYLYDRPEYHVQIGRPTEDPNQVAPTVYARAYEKGIAYVNASKTASATVTVPAGYEDYRSGEPLGATLVLPPVSARILLRTLPAACFEAPPDRDALPVIGVSVDGAAASAYVPDASGQLKVTSAAAGSHAYAFTAPGYLGITLQADASAACGKAVPVTLLRGDLNGDGSITLTDIVTAIRAFNGGTDAASTSANAVFGRKIDLSLLVDIIRSYNAGRQR